MASIGIWWKDFMAFDKSQNDGGNSTIRQKNRAQLIFSPHHFCLSLNAHTTGWWIEKNVKISKRTKICVNIQGEYWVRCGAWAEHRKLKIIKTKERKREKRQRGINQSICYNSIQCDIKCSTFEFLLHRRHKSWSVARINCVAWHINFPNGMPYRCLRSLFKRSCSCCCCCCCRTNALVKHIYYRSSDYQFQIWNRFGWTATWLCATDTNIHCLAIN